MPEIYTVRRVSYFSVKQKIKWTLYVRLCSMPKESWKESLVSVKSLAPEEIFEQTACWVSLIFRAWKGLFPQVFLRRRWAWISLRWQMGFHKERWGEAFREKKAMGTRAARGQAAGIGHSQIEKGIWYRSLSLRSNQYLSLRRTYSDVGSWDQLPNSGFSD